MKKLFIICVLITFYLLCNNLYLPKVYAQNIYYGRALASGIYIYSTPEITVDKSNRLFEIPITYFVEILNEENELFYKVNYNSITGFVLKNEVSCINTVPTTPYVTNATFRVFTPSGANLRSSPNETIGATNLITTISFMDTNLVYYGNCEGEESISYKGNIWYYCKYIKQNQEFFGYVYSPLCDLLTTISQNTEQFEYVTPTFDKLEQTNQTQKDYLSISSPLQVIIIVIISLHVLQDPALTLF